MNNPPDLGKLLQQAQQMQEHLASAQDELASMEFEGTAGGGMVKAVVTGDHRLLSVTIDPEVIDPEDAEMLQDLIVAAVNAATAAAGQAAEGQLGGLAGGLDLGGLLG